MSLNTQNNSAGPESLRFADFRLDLRTEELWRAGRRARLPRQSFRVLAMLVRAPGELVTREALQAALWPATSQVEWEQGLNAAMNRLREALRDSAANPRFIETLPRRGYRFIGQLEPGEELLSPLHQPVIDQAAAVEPGVPTPARSASRRLWVAVLLSVTILVLLALVILRWQPTLRPSAQPAQSHPFTALPGEERAPAFSPDGSRIVFAWNGGNTSGGGFDLYVKTIGSERLLRLTQTPARKLSPAWSPDGATIAFTREIEGNSGLFLVSAVGGAERRLASASFGSVPFMKPAWSPDGKHIIYAAFAQQGLQRLQILNVQNLAVTALPAPEACWNIGTPTFSDDGAQIAFACTTSVGVFDVYVTTPRGSAPKKLATIMGEPEGMTWSPDQRSLMLARDTGDGGSLWQLGANGSLTRLPFGEEGSAPARNRERIAYVRGRQRLEIWRMDLSAVDPAASASRFIYSTRAEMTPSYSSDRARIVFASNRSGSSEIWMTDGDGHEPVQLTHLEGPLAGAPSFCKDGRHIAFDARIGGRSRLYVLDIDERVPRVINSGDVDLSLPAWSEDCQWIIASDGRARLFTLSAAGGTAERFTKRDSYLAQVAGNRVVYNLTRSDGVRLAMKITPSGDEKELSAMPLLSYDDAWAATPLGVFFTTGARSEPTLNFYDFARASVRRIGKLNRPPAPGGGLGLAASRDGRELLYTQNADTETDIAIADIDASR